MAKKSIGQCFGLGGNRDDDDNPYRGNPRKGKGKAFRGQPYQKLEEPIERNPVEVSFYRSFDDRKPCATITVERNLCAGDLCRLLCLKLGHEPNYYWNIVEHWGQENMERTLEEHEYVLDAYYDLKIYLANREAVRYVFTQSVFKYDFLHHPMRCFQESMILIEDEKYFRRKLGCYLENLIDNDRCPTLVSSILFKKGHDGTWTKVVALLKERKLYVSSDEKIMKKLRILSEAKRLIGGYVSMREITQDDLRQLTEIADLSEYYVYGYKARPELQRDLLQLITTEPCTFALRPIVFEGDSTNSFYRFNTYSENIRLTWITAMRLAKYGKQIRENYRAFKNKQNVDPQSKEFSSQSVPNVVNTSPDLTQQRKKHDEHLAELDFTPPGADPEVMECSAYREAMKRILRENKAASSAQRAKSPKELGTIEKLAQSFSRSRVLSADGAGTSSQSDTMEIQDEAESPKSEIAKKLGAIKKVFQPPTEKRSKRKEEIEHQPGTSYGSVQEVLHFIPDQSGIENESLLTEEDDFEHEFVSPVAQSAALERSAFEDDFPDFAMLGPRGEYLGDHIPDPMPDSRKKYSKK